MLDRYSVRVCQGGSYCGTGVYDGVEANSQMRLSELFLVEAVVSPLSASVVTSEMTIPIKLGGQIYHRRYHIQSFSAI